MKKTYFLYTALLLMLCAFISSCSKDDYTGQSTLKNSGAVGTLNLDAPAVMEEKDTTIKFSITLDKPQVVDIKVRIHTSGDAELDHDYALKSTELIIPAFTTSVTSELKIFNDTEIENADTIILTIGDETTANLNFSPQTKQIILTNAVSSDLDLTFDWSGTAAYDGIEVALCDSVDLDMYVFDADGNDLGIYGAATGDCPEHLGTAGWADGDYYITANLYINRVRPTDGTVVEFPITITATQAGLFEDAMYHQAAANVIKSTDPDYYDDGAGVFKAVIKISKSGKNYTLTVL